MSGIFESLRGTVWTHGSAPVKVSRISTSSRFASVSGDDLGSVELIDRSLLKAVEVS
jgi:hypothetical protein